MAQATYGQIMKQAAQGWRALAERRRAHLVELYESGRWKHYYTDDEFLVAMRDAIQAVDRWAELAPRPDGARRQPAA